MGRELIIGLITLLLAWFLTGSSLMARNDAAFTIARNAGNVIVTCPENPTNAAAYNRRFAARELADYLERITGAKIPVVDAVDARQIESGGVIFVGPSSFTDAMGISRKRSDLGAGGYLIKTIAKNLLILGDDTENSFKLDESICDDAGTYYGVAAFLEKFGGVRWLWPGELGTVVPKRESLSVPCVEIKSQPAYSGRLIDCNVGFIVRKPDGTYSSSDQERALQLTLFMRRHGAGLSIQEGRANHNGGHYLDVYLKREEFKTHPEYFAFYDGKRQPWPTGSYGQVCNSNPDVVKLFADTIAKMCPPAGGDFSLCPNDGWGFCLCDKCKAMDKNARPWPDDARGWGEIPGAVYNEAFGGAYDISDRICTFNNQVARQVAERAPLATMGTIAYSCYVLPPEHVSRIEDNIRVNICDRWLTSDDSSKFKEGWEIFAKWGQKCSHLGLYGYYYAQTCRPHNFAATLRKFHKLGGSSHYAEAVQSWGNRWSETVAGLEAMWNPNLDVDDFLDDYLAAGFGPGRTALRRYLQLYEKASLTPMHTGATAPFASPIPKFPGKMWPPDVRATLRSYLDQALMATKGSEYEARVRFVEEGWELVDSMCGLGEAAADLRAMGLAMPGFDQETIPSCNATPDEVNARLLDAKKCWDRLQAVTTKVEEKQGFSVPWHSRNLYAGAFWGDLAANWGAAVETFHAALFSGSAAQLPGKLQAIPLENGDFDGKTIAPWIVNGEGAFFFRLIPESGGQALEWTLGKNVSAGSLGAVGHPAMSNLRFGPAKAYRLSFAVKGKKGNTVVRSAQVAAPLVVRVCYSEEKPKGEREYRYDWISFYPDATKRMERMMLVSPDANRWQLAGVTFFCWQAGTYLLDDVTLESW